MGETILGVNTNFVLKNIMDQTKIWSKFWVDFFSHKKCLGQKKFWLKESLGQKGGCVVPGGNNATSLTNLQV